MLKSEIEILACLSFLSLVYFVSVQSDCIIKYPLDIKIAPTYTKYFGKYHLEIPYTRNDIILKNGETISGSCQTMFSNFMVYNDHRYSYSVYEEIIGNQTDITLQCEGNILRYDNKVLNANKLMCEELIWSTYDDNVSHKWCEVDERSKTFLLATKSAFNYHILAEICFDLNEWSLQTITYNITAPFDDIEMLKDIRKSKLRRIQSLGDNLWNFKSAGIFDLNQTDLQQQLKQMSQSNAWLHLANYEISSIVQGKFYKSYFEEFSNLINTIWWPNLRLGNWKRFMNTLENYAYNNSFQLYTGTSGVVRSPANDNGIYYNNLEIEIGVKRRLVPAYIWTYLISTDNTNRDFVVVGYNSPYAEFFNLKEIVFCPDICAEISWLNKIYASFKFATAGITFCCTPEFIQQTNYLKGFPMHVLTSRLKQENKTVIEDSTISLSSTSTEQISNLEIEMYSTTTIDPETKTEGEVYSNIDDDYLDD